MLAFVSNMSKMCDDTVNVKFTQETSHEDPQGKGEQSYTPTLSLTSALYKSGWSTPRPGRFTPGKDPAPIV